MNAEGMNRDGTTAAPGAHGALPPLDDRRVEEIERALFAEIDRDRRARRVRRGRIWLGGTAAAAVVVVGALVVPAVIGGLSGTSSGSSIAPQFDAGTKGSDAGGTAQSGSGGIAAVPSRGDKPSTGDTGVAREIVTTATATVEARDVRAAIERISTAATARKGYVEAMSIGTVGATATTGTGSTAPSPDAPEGALPASPTGDGGWVTVRVPAASLPALISDLARAGTVHASAIDRVDVTSQAVDLRARIDALEASVSRLTQLMAKAGSVADLLSAESALSSRQADLESYEQQLKALESQVAMSTLTVTVTPHPTIVRANPAGFGDGLAAGWSGFVATVNGLVVAIGFVLPWLAVVVLLAAITWAVVLLARAIRSRRNRAA